MTASACFSSYAEISAVEQERLREAISSGIVTAEGNSVDTFSAPSLFLSIAQDYELSQASKAEGQSNTADTAEANIQVSVQALPFNTFNTLQQPAVSSNSLIAMEEDGTLTTADEPITPLCPSLSTGTLYDASEANTGGEYCYHFNVPSRSKANVFVTNITEGSDMRLSLLRHGPDDSLILIGQSDNAGNDPEIITALTEAGDYYWFIEAVEADNASFSFATTLNTYADAYEVNETPSQATVLPNRVVNIVANIDSAADYDFYSLETHGQELLFYLTQETMEAPDDQWLFDYYNGSAWVRVANGGGAAPTLTSGSTLYLRVYHNPDQGVHPEYNYRLNVGSRVADINWHNVDGDLNLEIPYRAVPSAVYEDVRLDEARNLVTQAHEDITWSARLLDSTGEPVEGAVAVFYYTLIGEEWSAERGVTNKNGVAGGEVSLGRCVENYISEPFDDYDFGGVRSWWQSTFNFGLWFIEVVNARDGVGVGSAEGRKVSIGHICDHNFLRSEH